MDTLKIWILTNVVIPCYLVFQAPIQLIYGSYTMFLAQSGTVSNSHCTRRRKHFFGGQAKIKFNYIHEHDIIIIDHERYALEQGYWHAIAADKCLTRQRKKMAVISKKQIKPKETPLILWIINEAKKWSGQNLTSRTGSAAHAAYV